LTPKLEVQQRIAKLSDKLFDGDRIRILKRLDCLLELDLNDQAAINGFW